VFGVILSRVWQAVGFEGEGFMSPRGVRVAHGCAPYADSIKARMSSTRQAVILSPSVLTGFGYRPDATPAHQVDRLTGMVGEIGGSHLGSLTIWGRRRKPVAGSLCDMDFSYPYEHREILRELLGHENGAHPLKCVN